MIYVRPDESLMFAPVSGTVDATYDEDWLTHGEPGHPVRTTGDMSLTVTPASSQLVDLIAICHHNVEEGATIGIGGSHSTTIDTQPWPPDDIPANWYRLLATPVSTATLVLSISGNTDPIVVGTLYAGLSRTLPPLVLGRRRNRISLPEWESQAFSLAPYDAGVQRRQRVTGSFILTEEQMNELEDWYVSQRNGSRPTLIVPDYPVDVAWLCTFDYDASDFVPGDALVGGSPEPDQAQALFAVTMDISVIPPVRW